METAETTNYKNYTINVYYDECAESPRKWDNLGTIYSNHREYNPDGHSIDELGDLMDDILANLNENYYYLPIYAYIHSGIALSVGDNSYPFNDRWDSGLFGFIAITKDKAIKLGYDEEKILKYLEGEVEILNRFYDGEVYGYEILNQYDEEVDSCWGFIEDIDYVINEAKSVVDNILGQEAKKKYEEGTMTFVVEVKYKKEVGCGSDCQNDIREAVKELTICPNYHSRSNGVAILSCEEVPE